jgi:hypothetical protein
MSYEEKYLKYKKKYLILSNQYSGGLRCKSQNKKEAKTKKSLYKVAKIKTMTNKLLNETRIRIKKRDEINKNKDCKRIKKYVNIDLGISLFGSGEPRYKNMIKYEECFELLIKEEIVFYITFNENITKVGEKEGEYFNTICNKKYNINNEKQMCKFISLIIEDYHAPTLDQLINFWLILDEFYRIKLPRQNILLHCSLGYGRTGFMIMSYIWLKQLIIEETTGYKKLDTLEYIMKCIDCYDILDETIHKSSYNKKDKKREEQILDKIIDEPEYNSFRKYIVYDNDIRKTKTMLFLQNELYKYEPSSYYEVFFEIVEDPQLLIKRIEVFIKAYNSYKLLNNEDKKHKARDIIGALSEFLDEDIECRLEDYKNYRRNLIKKYENTSS